MNFLTSFQSRMKINNKICINIPSLVFAIISKFNNLIDSRSESRALHTRASYLNFFRTQLRAFISLWRIFFIQLTASTSTQLNTSHFFLLNFDCWQCGCLNKYVCTYVQVTYVGKFVSVFSARLFFLLLHGGYQNSNLRTFFDSLNFHATCFVISIRYVSTYLHLYAFHINSWIRLFPRVAAKCGM